ncbi:MAG: HAD family hydrolase [Candidatus Doudnabacteria bacterium]|nr:HAD family hydrolase [Candidatus Doudnabacteria bacterium]
MKKAVLLDFDGVVADSIEQSIARWDHNAKAYGNGMDVTADVVRSNATGVWRIFYTEVLGIPADKVEEAGEFWRQLAQKDPLPPFFDGMKEVIESLSKDYGLYMLSSNSNELIKKTFQSHDVIKYFKGIAGDVEVGNLDKTDPEYVLSVLRTWNLKPENVIYTGDTSDEVIGGRRAGVKTIGCAWGYQYESLIKAAGPDAIAKSPQEPPAVIARVLI